MKKITLKCYSYRDPESLLMQAANIVATKTKTRTLVIRTRTKSAMINVAEPLLALAAADEIRRKTGVVVIVADLPTNVVHFVKFLKERGLLEEWCVRTLANRQETLLLFLTYKPLKDYLFLAFEWGFSKDHTWVMLDAEWHRYILNNNL